MADDALKQTQDLIDAYARKSNTIVLETIERTKDYLLSLKLRLHYPLPNTLTLSVADLRIGKLR